MKIRIKLTDQEKISLTELQVKPKQIVGLV